MNTKSNGRQELEKTIMDKIQNIFDNAEYINHFNIVIMGAYDSATIIKYNFEERIVPKGETE